MEREEDGDAYGGTNRQATVWVNEVYVQQKNEHSKRFGIVSPSTHRAHIKTETKTSLVTRTPIAPMPAAAHPGVRNFLDMQQSTSNLHTSKHVFRKHRPGGRVSVSTRQQMLMQSLTEFFTNPAHIAQFKELVKKGAPISLRVIDWFVTNYSKDKDVTYRKGSTWSASGIHSHVAGGGVKDALEDNRMIHVHESYKAQLKAYSKRQFDPFCRRDRIHFYYTPTEKVETTVGQLNFFRWAIENHVTEYVGAHLKDIESAMRVYVKAQRDARRKLAKKGKHLSSMDSGLEVGANTGSASLIGGGKTRRRTSGSKTATQAMNATGTNRRNIYTTRASTTVYFS